MRAGETPAVDDPNPSSDLTLAGLVHDLNNVFETISEAAELVSDDPKWRAMAQAIHRSVERGRRIVGLYADQSRSGPELDLIVERAATFLQDFLTHLPGTKVKVVRKVPAGLSLQGDPSDWERVFMNLFLNAAQAMKENGGGEIEVVARLGDGLVEMLVRDNGPGIPDAILGKIFKPRFSTRTKHGGLGLHIVHSITQQCGGTVTAENRKDSAGALFTITAPVA
ncbi:HAMP domain-containing sensor histidine kinase [uncultured Paludibaculum sp.]|uniref:sensor histidine kinase n=1 Tax=uncultured Paludibaculum sp. TaxID=1765020 RepID=UPI002AAC40F8|nr:HAMP domain-containing sensor histidine kinase [uncultured Paludibaculum sp.]